MDMMFHANNLKYDKANEHSVLDFTANIFPLEEEDKYSVWDSGNYSLAGFEMRLERHTFKYIANYYLPSGLFVVVSWVCLTIMCFK